MRIRRGLFFSTLSLLSGCMFLGEPKPQVLLPLPIDSNEFDRTLKPLTLQFSTPPVLEIEYLHDGNTIQVPVELVFRHCLFERALQRSLPPDRLEVTEVELSAGISGNGPKTPVLFGSVTFELSTPGEPTVARVRVSPKSKYGTYYRMPSSPKKGLSPFWSDRFVEVEFLFFQDVVDKLIRHLDGEPNIEGVTVRTEEVEKG